MKTNKSFTKRLRVTKTGKILARVPGQNHFNSRVKSSKQLEAKRGANFHMTSREKARFLPGLLA
jgi:ribosomal protein L35